MTDISINTRSSIRLAGSVTIYFDPLELPTAPHDADLILVTHEHFDHYSPDDINKIANANTRLIIPATMLGKVKADGLAALFEQPSNLICLAPGDSVDLLGAHIAAVPAYNIGKPFHPKSNSWLGYVVTLDSRTYYAMGDTDDIPEAHSVRADELFIPIGGKYTMDATEAAAFVKSGKWEKVWAIHYEGEECKEKYLKELEK